MSFLLTKWTRTNSSQIWKTQSLSVDISHWLFLGISLAWRLFHCVNTPEENFLVLLAVIWWGLGWQAAWGCRLGEDHSSSRVNLRCSVHCWLSEGDSKQPLSAFLMEKELQVLQAGCWLHPRGSEVGGPAVLPWAVTSGWSSCQKPSLKGQGQWLSPQVRSNHCREGPIRHKQGVGASDCLHPG